MQEMAKGTPLTKIRQIIDDTYKNQDLVPTETPMPPAKK
jgi:hypothetical protein